MSSALQICSSLQAAKAATVSGVAAATLQQLVTTVFEKVAIEDRETDDSNNVVEVSGRGGPIHLHPAAHDAYRVFRDLAMAADERKTKFVQFTSLSAESSLELIWSCVNSNTELFAAHDELMSIVGSNIFPLITRALSERLSFPITVRLLRLLGLILDQWMSKFRDDCEVALNLCTQGLDPSSAPLWKRALIMEIVRNFFVNSSNLVEAYSAFDLRNNGKAIVQDLMSTFVRLSTEKPAAIGLGRQSTVPAGPLIRSDTTTEHATLEAAGGMAGVMSSAFGAIDVSVTGVSSQWSLPKLPCTEQLDKRDPPNVPDTYLYVLVLECLNGISDNLARLILPLTVQRGRVQQQSSDGKSEPDQDAGNVTGASSPLRAVPPNPLLIQGIPQAAAVEAAAAFVESSWPAVLATASTFLNAALDDQYFRNLIKAYQRFTQVAGLLRLVTPRDALMTTLAKAAVPPHVLKAVTVERVRTPTTDSPRILSDMQGILGVDTFTNNASSSSSSSFADSQRQHTNSERPSLTIRNLLCLRALLNLAIALGPILEAALPVVVNALRRADLVLGPAMQILATRPSASKGVDAAQAYTNEVAAVESAATRLIESTVDYPDESFVNVLQTFSGLLHDDSDESDTASTLETDRRPLSPLTPRSDRRTFSDLSSLQTSVPVQERDYQFVIPKLGMLAELNVPRFVRRDAIASGWRYLVEELVYISTANIMPRAARRSATDVLLKLVEAIISDAANRDPTDRSSVQRRAFAVLVRLGDEIYTDRSDVTSTDLEIQGHVLDCLQAVLERCGDSLVAGWNRIIAIIGTAFEHKGTISRGSDQDEVDVDWTQVSCECISGQLGRSAFAATQLVCSDFLEALPASVCPSLVELLYRFMCQTEDLNVALTTVTLAWNACDFLFKQFAANALSEFLGEAEDFSEVETHAQLQRKHSRPAQWISLIMRLCDVAVRSQQQTRTAAFQTVCNVFQNQGQQLPTKVWELIPGATLLRVVSADAATYSRSGPSADSASHDDRSVVEMSKVLIIRSSAVLAQNLHAIQQIAQLSSFWQSLLTTLERYLDANHHDLDAAVYASLSQMLSQVPTSVSVWTDPACQALSLWLRRPPQATTTNSSQSNQEAFLAYSEAGQEIYRLTIDAISTAQCGALIDNLYQCIWRSNSPFYGADVSKVSSLQSSVMRLLKAIRADSPETAAHLITIAAKLSSLHHDSGLEDDSRNRPSFVAIASDAISWLEVLVKTGLSQSGSVVTGVIPHATTSLRRIIESKYAFRSECEGQALWRRATTTALALAKPVLRDAQKYDCDTRDVIWNEYAAIASGIIQANGLGLVDDKAEVRRDQAFDIESFETLRGILVPTLGRTDLPDQAIATYTRALFDASIIHQPEMGEVPAFGSWPLEHVGEVRRGRVKAIPYSQREDMAYVCWKELIALSSKGDGSAECKRLARTAAPLLVLRLAIPVRAYIADQPLRGSKPQPLSELEELLFSFETIKHLQLDPEALSPSRDMTGPGGGRAHMHYLYPLMVRAVETAGDKWSGAEEVLTPLQKTLASVGMVVSAH